MRQSITDELLQNHLKLYARLTLTDLLELEGPLRIGDTRIDAIVTVNVLYTGDDSLEIESVGIVDDHVDIMYDDGSVFYINYRNSDNSSFFLLVDEFLEEVKRIALEKAKNTPEINWEYTLE